MSARSALLVLLRSFCSERSGLERRGGADLASGMAETAPQLVPVAPRPADDRPTDPRAADREPAPTVEPLWRHMLGDRLRRLRHERGETLGDTATRAGVSPQYLSEMERGAKEPSSEMIAAVAGALDVTLLDLTLAVAESLRTARPAQAPAGRAMLALAA
jgi:DNA-binding XRE family transcriptional regulator